jgi:methyl-accepting chemotaxis protein
MKTEKGVSMSQQGRPKRRQYFIKKDFQTKFIVKFCLLILAGVIISTVVVFLFTRGTLTSSFEHGRLVIKNTSLAILPAVMYTNIVTLGLISLASILVTLFVSHKIAGPLFRIVEDLKIIEQGDLTKKISFRGKDQLTELADSINKTTTSLHEKVFTIQTDVEHLLESASKQNAPKLLIEGLNHLKQEIKSNFKT